MFNREKWFDRNKKMIDGAVNVLLASVQQYIDLVINSDLKGILIQGVEKTESPVEQLFLVASNQYLLESGFDQTVPEWMPRGAVFAIIPQKTVTTHGKTYRADFSLSILRYDFSDESPDPEEHVFANVFVEIDGHDFHEKTKEQVAHDKQREREMAPFADMILRFTGSEVYRDPFSCASESFKALGQAYKRKQQ